MSLEMVHPSHQEVGDTHPLQVDMHHHHLLLVVTPHLNLVMEDHHLLLLGMAGTLVDIGMQLLQGMVLGRVIIIGDRRKVGGRGVM